MTNVIRDACTASMKIRGGGRQFNPWWTQELEAMKKECIRLHQRLSVASRRGLPTDVAASEHRAAKVKYGKEVRKTSNVNFRSFCNKQGKEDVWTLTNRLIKDAPTKKPPSTLKCGTTFTTSAAETADALIRHFYPDDTDDVMPNQVRLRERQNVLSTSDNEPHFTPAEVSECLINMNPNRAPGLDNLTSDICGAFIDTYPDFFTGIVNRCLDVGHFPTSWEQAYVMILQKPGRDDYSDLSSFRPIRLLPVFGKLFEKLFIKRLTFDAQTKKTWSPEQYGFREQTSTTDALRSVINRIKSAKSRGRHVIGVSLDIKAAFDNAWWPALMERLRQTQCPANIHRLIQSYLVGRSVTLDCVDARVSKSMTKGCIQGSVCGPTFWNIILDDLLNVSLPTGCHIQGYADDVMLLVEGASSSDVELSVNAALDIIHCWGTSFKLTFSPAKTKAIAFTRKSKDVSLFMNSVNIPFSDDIRLLGVIIDSNVNFIKHAKFIIAKVSKTFKNLCKFVRPTWGVHPENVDVLYRHVIEPTITYAAGIWGQAAERESVKRLFRTFQRTFAIRMH